MFKKIFIASLIFGVSASCFAQEKEEHWGMHITGNGNNIQQLTPEQAKALVSGKKSLRDVKKETPKRHTERLAPNVKNQKPVTSSGQQSTFTPKKENFNKNNQAEFNKEKEIKPFAESKFSNKSESLIEKIKGDREVGKEVHSFSKSRRFSNTGSGVTITR